jgi:hypothetical protein
VIKAISGKGFNLRLLQKIGTFWLVVIVSTGCGGMGKQHVMAPRVPVLFDHPEMRVTVGSVLLSEKMTWIFGGFFAAPTPLAEEKTVPGSLKIGVTFDLKIGTASFDPDAFVVLFGDDHKIHKPTSVSRVHYENDKEERRLTVVTEEVPGTEFLTAFPRYEFLLGSGKKVVRPGPDPSVYSGHRFTYEIAREEFSEDRGWTTFVFRPGDIELNGRTISLPEVTFEHKTRDVTL